VGQVIPNLPNTMLGRTVLLTLVLPLLLLLLQVGQVILNLPNSMSKAGLPLGTFFQLWAAVVSMYTLWLLSMLYQEFKRRAVSAVWQQQFAETCFFDCSTVCGCCECCTTS
jgi:hypothetical protein